MRVRVRAGAAVAHLVVRGDVGLVAGLAQPGRGDNQVTCLPAHEETEVGVITRQHVARARGDGGRCSHPFRLNVVLP